MKLGVRIWVIAALAALLLVGLAACTPKDGPLSEQELAEWEERLNTPEWSAFLSHQYSSVQYLNLSRVFAAGAGFAEAAGDGTVTLAAEEMDALLQARTGLGLSDLSDTLSDWTYLEGEDSYRGQSREPKGPVTVTAGQRENGAVTLTLERTGEEAADLTLTAEEQIVSYTNGRYNAVEAMALDLLAKAVRRVESEGGAVEGAYISYLSCADRSEDGRYALWDVDYRIRTDRGERLSAMEAEMVNGWFTARTDRGSPRFVVALGEGTCTLVATLYSGDTGGMTWEEYVDFVMEQGIENADLNNGWPELTEDMTAALAGGGRQWVLSREGVIAAYLWQFGDELAGWETVSLREGSGRWMDQHAVVTARTTAEDRTYTLLLSHRTVPYGAGEEAVELSVWQVTGNTVQGTPLPEVAAETGDAQARLEAFQAALPEETECYVAWGGGVYADYQWSLCVPEGWSRSGDRWYPDGEDLAAYLEVRSHQEDYSDADFYTSFARSYRQVRSSYGTGAETPWARGESARGQVTEALLCRTAEGEVWEVMWTYPAEEDSTLLAAAAATFRRGETGVTAPEPPSQAPLTVKDRGDTWAVLGSFQACALEETLVGDSFSLLAPYREAYYTYTFSQLQAESLTWVRTAQTGENRWTVLYRVQLAIKAEPPGPEVALDPARPEDNLPVDADGFWRPEEPVWLAVGHDGEQFLAAAAFHASGSPGEEDFERAMTQALEKGALTDRTMYLDPETGKISARR